MGFEYSNNFENGPLGTTIGIENSGYSGDAFDAGVEINSPSTLVYDIDTLGPPVGRCAKATVTSGRYAYVKWYADAGTTRVGGSIDFQLADYPSGDGANSYYWILLAIVEDSGGIQFHIDSTGHLRVYGLGFYGTGSEMFTTTAVIPLDTWVRITYEFKCTNPGYYNVRLYNDRNSSVLTEGNSSSPTWADPGTEFDYMNMGFVNGTSPGTTIRFDNLTLNSFGLPGSYAAPVVTRHPKSASVRSGATVNLVSTASGIPAPTVQWESTTDPAPTTGLPSLNGVIAAWALDTPGLVFPGQPAYPDLVSTWVEMTGETSTTLSFTASSEMRYRAVFTNDGGTATSAAARIAIAADADYFDDGGIVPGSIAVMPGAGTPGSGTGIYTPGIGGSPATSLPGPSGAGFATVLALVREFSAQVKRAVRITGPTSIEMVDPAAINDLLSVDADVIYSSATTQTAADAKALAVLGGPTTTAASAVIVSDDVALLLSGWRIPDRLPVRGMDAAPVKAVRMDFTPDRFTASVEFHTWP